jgi:hypothetical protein
MLLPDFNRYKKIENKKISFLNFDINVPSSKI